MVPGWGTLSCRDPHDHLKHFLEKLQKTEAHVRTDDTAGQDGVTRASGVVSPGPAHSMDWVTEPPATGGEGRYCLPSLHMGKLSHKKDK